MIRASIQSSLCGQRIAAAANRPELPMEFKVMRLRRAKCFLFARWKNSRVPWNSSVAKNEAGLANSEGHEVTHAIARHGGQTNLNESRAHAESLRCRPPHLRITKPRLYQWQRLTGKSVRDHAAHGRFQKTEADEWAFDGAGGYYPTESIQFWHRFLR